MSATNSTKSNKALTCWVHDVLMHRSGTKVRQEEFVVAQYLLSTTAINPERTQSCSFRIYVYEDDGCDILAIAFRNGFAISKGSNRDRFAILRKNVDDNPTISGGDKFNKKITLKRRGWFKLGIYLQECNMKYLSLKYFPISISFFLSFILIIFCF